MRKIDCAVQLDFDPSRSENIRCIAFIDRSTIEIDKKKKDL